MEFIIIETGETEAEIYPLTTDAEYEDAKAALQAAGLKQADVWAGDPDGPDAVKTGQILWAE